MGYPVFLTQSHITNKATQHNCNQTVAESKALEVQLQQILCLPGYRHSSFKVFCAKGKVSEEFFSYKSLIRVFVVLSTIFLGFEGLSGGLEVFLVVLLFELLGAFREPSWCFPSPLGRTGII